GALPLRTATAAAPQRRAFLAGRPRPMKPEDDDYPPEKLAALRTVRKLVEFWNITEQELLDPLPPPPPPPLAGTLPIRYRHPVSGETWDGQGEHPAWLREALLKQGYTVDELKRAVTQGADDAGG